VSLSNIGDVVLTFPVIDILKKEFPAAKLSIVIGPKANGLFDENPFIERVHIFDKHQSGLKSLAWIGRLRKERFDLAVDLRNTAIPILISAKYRTTFRAKRKSGMHMKDKHLDRLRSVYAFERKKAEPVSLFIPKKEEEHVGRIVEKSFGRFKKFIVVAPGAADRSKRWPESQFTDVCNRLTQDHGLGVVFVGSSEDGAFARKIMGGMKDEAFDLCGRTNLLQLAEILNHCAFAIVNDSAPMHIASYQNVPVMALFGPTSPYLYGPWGEQSFFLWKNENCHACAKPKSGSRHTCMEAIKPEDVMNILKARFLDNPYSSANER